MTQPTTTLLLVEDNPDDAILLSGVLDAAAIHRFQLDHVETMAEAIERIAHRRYDIILLDLSLPDSTGIGTLRTMLQHAVVTPVIVLTGLDDERVGEESIHSGAQDYIVKGVMDGSGLARSIRYAIERFSLVRALADANAVNTSFAATMSHELRNSLTIINGYSEMLLSGASNSLSEQDRHMVATILRESEDSNDLIRATLELTHGESKEALGEPVETSLTDLLDTLESTMRVPQDKADVRLEYRIERDLPNVHADPTKVTMILKNLIGNALKFTEAGSITVRARTSTRGAIVEIEDTGIGIPEHELRTLFDPFRQAHGTTSRNAGGAGLGLFIVKRLTDLIGGEIEVDSRPQGTVFRLVLSVASSEAA